MSDSHLTDRVFLVDRKALLFEDISLTFGFVMSCHVFNPLKKIWLLSALWRGDSFVVLFPKEAAIVVI